MENLIVLNNVSKIYRMGDEKIVALDDISLSIKEKEFICLLGTSGSEGTLLNMMAGRKTYKRRNNNSWSAYRKMNEKTWLNFVK